MKQRPPLPPEILFVTVFVTLLLFRSPLRPRLHVVLSPGRRLPVDPFQMMYKIHIGLDELAALCDAFVRVFLRLPGLHEPVPYAGDRRIRHELDQIVHETGFQGIVRSLDDGLGGPGLQACIQSALTRAVQERAQTRAAEIIFPLSPA